MNKITLSSYKGKGKGSKSYEKQMVEYIKQHFAHLLGDDIKLLDLPNGLNLLRKKLDEDHQAREKRRDVA